jgi:hypothetical protein
VAFSTSPGKVALDGEEGNSPYALALSEALAEPNLQIEGAFKAARKRVVERTRGEQVPWDSSSLVEDYYIGKALEETPTAKSARNDTNREAAEAWLSLGANPSISLIDAFIKLYPGTPMATIAQAKKEELKIAATQPPANQGSESKKEKVQFFPLIPQDLDLLEEQSTAELDKYVTGFGKGEYTFVFDSSGEDAAKSLGFSGRFAAYYDEIRRAVEKHNNKSGSMDIKDFEKLMEKIRDEEKSVDKLRLSGKSDVSMIVFLRAMQNGKASYPSISNGMPDIADIHRQMLEAYPDIKSQSDFAKFETDFSKLHTEMMELLRSEGEVSFYDIVPAMRKVVLTNR